MATILVVEDDKSTTQLLTHVLKNAGHTVFAAATGSDGVILTRSHRPDLVIMDMSLPKMTGWEATRALKADEATRAIPILALSGATTTGDRDEAYDAGCVGYETKPVDINRLLTRVAELAARPKP